MSAQDVFALLPKRGTSGNPAGAQESYVNLSYMDAKRKTLDEFTSCYLRAKLAMHDGHISKAAEDSGIPRQHFSLLMKRYLSGEDQELF